MTYEWFTGSTATNQINYSTLTSTAAPDSNSYASGYATPYFAVATNGLETVNFRRIYYNTTNLHQFLTIVWALWLDSRAPVGKTVFMCVVFLNFIIKI